MLNSGPAASTQQPAICKCSKPPMKSIRQSLGLKDNCVNYYKFFDFICQILNVFSARIRDLKQRFKRSHKSLKTAISSDALKKTKFAKNVP
jgi:hypothetical protein